MTSKLFLHIGHGKTGSSFLQSCFSKNRDHLLSHGGVVYPIDPEDQSQYNKISSGNGRLFQKAARENALSDLPWDSNANAIFYSSEFLYNDTSWMGCEAVFDGSLVSAVDILLFIRNPLEMLSTCYQQIVKRGGYFKSFDEYAAGFKFYGRLLRVLQDLQGRDRCSLRVCNYSRISHTEDVAAAWLGCPPFKTVPRSRINRSLTFSELFFQIEINRYFGKSGSFVADALCNELPDQEAYVFSPSQQALTMFLEHEMRYIEAINRIIPETEALEISSVARDAEFPEVFLGEDQLRLIAESFGKKFARQND